jgi:hypothetical protein
MFGRFIVSFAGALRVHPGRFAVRRLVAFDDHADDEHSRSGSEKYCGNARQMTS